MAIGVTASERYLSELARKSFLSLWSYPNLYTAEGRKNGKGSGEELCDLLVIFRNHVLLFSDKHCEFSTNADINIAWARWYRKAVLKSCRQLLGAESWIKRFPEHIYLDKECKQSLPFPLPPVPKIRFHRFAVTRGSYSKCKEYFKGESTGSLIINTGIIGDAHKMEPFNIGFVLPNDGYIHVLDELTLEVLLREFDTITDFLAYIQKKEELLTKPNRIVLATGEEQLVAEYMRHLDNEEKHYFGEIPNNVDELFYQEGSWEEFIQSKEYESKKQAEKQSYFWDNLIEHFIKMHNTVGYHGETVTIEHVELALRILAQEPRLRRRVLSSPLIEVLKKELKQGQTFARLSMSNSDPDNAYVFLSVARSDFFEPYDKYREFRLAMTLAYCKVAKLRAKKAKYIVGIAFEPHGAEGRSEDLVLLLVDDDNWGEVEENEARVLQKEAGILLDERLVTYETHDNEYPSSLDIQK